MWGGDSDGRTDERGEGEGGRKSGVGETKTRPNCLPKRSAKCTQTGGKIDPLWLPNQQWNLIDASLSFPILLLPGSKTISSLSRW